MFCYKCGKEIADEVNFCPKCGAKQNVIANKVKTDFQSSSSSSGDFDRKAIEIYLSNVLALECAKMKLANDWEQTENELNYQYMNNYIQSYTISNGHIWLAYHDGKVHLGCFDAGDYGGSGAYTGEFLNREHMTDGKGFVEYVWGQEVLQHEGRFYWGIINEKSLKHINKTSFWWDIGGSNKLQQISRQVSARDSFIQLYTRFKSEAPKIYQENDIKIVQPLRQKFEGVKHEYEKADELLKTAYNINIIPHQFRNFEAVWYIRDFITSSSETLTTALLHCDLDKIKQKLDTIIDQQKEIILNQAIEIAQNNQIINQNQEVLDNLSRIESNTDRAAKYSQIAANNAEACAWIGIANYIRK